MNEFQENKNASLIVNNNVYLLPDLIRYATWN